jgi:hypothetical protein
MRAMEIMTNHLPLDVIKYLQGYLKFQEWFNFVNASKRSQQLKYQSVYFSLKSKYSFLYLSDLSFRSHVLSLIEDPFSQLCLHFGYSKLPLNFEYLQNIHTICFNTYFSTLDISQLKNITHLKISECADIGHLDILQVNHLGIQKFDLSSNRTIQDTLWIHCPATDFSTMYHDKEFDGSSSLFSIKSLNFSNCFNLNNISTLNNLYELNLTNCYQLEDISSLIHIHSLDLTHCVNITSLMSLKHCSRLILDDCFQIDEIPSHLLMLTSLSIKNCYQIRSLLSLSGSQLEELNTTNCSMLEMLPSSLPALKKGIFDQCRQLLEVPFYPNLLHFSLKGCLSLEDLNHYFSAEKGRPVMLYLNIKDCSRIVHDRIMTMQPPIAVTRLIMSKTDHQKRRQAWGSGGVDEEENERNDERETREEEEEDEEEVDEDDGEADY